MPNKSLTDSKLRELEGQMEKCRNDSCRYVTGSHNNFHLLSDLINHLQQLMVDITTTNPKHFNCVKYFPGATTEDMEDFIKPILRKELDNIIIHVGANDVKAQEPRLTAKGIHAGDFCEQKRPDDRRR